MARQPLTVGGSEVPRNWFSRIVGTKWPARNADFKPRESVGNSFPEIHS